ncbi:hypothetical protein BD410DRAFT_831144 [Rickenella mellea]|uniref:Uncharacterized protein n=1 Tax=Rickenella mellea TaxID=50990 RepID=A0A4Y7PU20_9AGAM|nr:hypothetical protein BD410DRAFT_831144 [Rickenella mellea]
MGMASVDKLEKVFREIEEESERRARAEEEEHAPLAASKFQSSSSAPALAPIPSCSTSTSTPESSVRRASVSVSTHDHQTQNKRRRASITISRISSDIKAMQRTSVDGFPKPPTEWGKPITRPMYSLKTNGSTSSLTSEESEGVSAAEVNHTTQKETIIGRRNTITKTVGGMLSRTFSQVKSATTGVFPGGMQRRRSSAYGGSGGGGEDGSEESVRIGVRVEEVAVEVVEPEGEGDPVDDSQPSALAHGAVDAEPAVREAAVEPQPEPEPEPAHERERDVQPLPHAAGDVASVATIAAPSNATAAATAATSTLSEERREPGESPSRSRSASVSASVYMPHIHDQNTSQADAPVAQNLAIKDDGDENLNAATKSTTSVHVREVNGLARVARRWARKLRVMSFGESKIKST